MKRFEGHFNSKKLSATVDDDGLNNVKQYYFKGAVVDNFAPINEQEYWSGPEGSEDGQRFWVNPEFFKVFLRYYNDQFSLLFLLNSI